MSEYPFGYNPNEFLTNDGGMKPPNFTWFHVLIVFLLALAAAAWAGGA